MKKVLFISLMLLMTSFIFAQEQCGFETMLNSPEKKEKYRVLEEKLQARIEKMTNDKSALERSGNPMVIPVVVHVIHLGEPEGVNYNISELQILSAIDHMNDFYGGRTGSLDFGIQFKLATVDVDFLPTNGINRVNGSGVPGYSTKGIITSGADENMNQVKNLSKWDDVHYLNIWVVTEINGNDGAGGTQGFADFYDGFWGGGGVVLMASTFGYDLGNTKGWGYKFVNGVAEHKLNLNGSNITTIHEVGHFLNLYHTFQGATRYLCPPNNHLGDRCADTEPHKYPSDPNPPATNDCTGRAFGDSTAKNIMGYYRVRDRFTNDQKTRAIASISGKSIVDTTKDSHGYSIQTSWTGAGGNSNWLNANNWTNGVPTTTDNAEIRNTTNQPIITQGVVANVKNLTVNHQATLTVDSGGVLGIEENLTQNGTLIVNSNATHNGSLSMKGFTNRTITYNRYLTTSANSSEGWHLVTSPVKNVKISDFYSDLAQDGAKRSIAKYVNTNASGQKWSYYTTANSSDVFVKAKGYSIKKSVAGTLAFEGELNSITSIRVEATGDKYNAIGNPYASYINANDFLNNTAQATLTEKTIWLWDSATKKYITKNLNDSYLITPGQGFFVQAQTTGNVSFSSSYQVNQAGGSHLRSGQIPEITLKMSDGIKEDSSRIVFSDNKTTGFDNGYDSSIFEGFDDSFRIYTDYVDNNITNKLAIQTLPNLTQPTYIVPVGVVAESGKTLTFSASTTSLPSSLPIVLEDRLKNVFTTLTSNSQYQITLSNNLNGTGRFYLHTNNSSLGVQQNILNSVKVFSNNHTLFINGLPNGSAQIRVYDVLGKLHIDKKLDNTNSSISTKGVLQTGIYIVDLHTNQGSTKRKIIVE